MIRPTTRCSFLAWAVPLAILALIASGSAAAAVAGYSQDMEAGFQSPPDAARPWGYWFWMNGNITREGITADLEAMKRVGIGGTLIMSVSTGIPPGKVDFMSREWRELFTHAVREADRLGLQIIMNNDDGWTGSGGPWNRVEHSMQVLTSSETQVKGPKTFDGVLPRPPAKLDYYRDIAVLAIPAPATGDSGPAARIENLPAKTAATRADRIRTAIADANVSSVPPEKIVNLTSKLSPDGRLRWNAPEGDWTLVRLGHTTNGRVNHPCSPQGVGLECDKLSKEALDAHFAGLLAKLIADVGPLAGKSLMGTHVDSWEVGSQNWTPKLREEFTARRGYDPTPYLAALVGRAVGSLEISERFLWDFRKTLADMMADNYFGHLCQLAARHGMIMSVEAYDNGNFDNLQAASRTDVPMAEFWVGWPGRQETAKWASSAGHVAGRKIVAAESFTAFAANDKWQNHPYKLKALGDLMFADGVNRFVFHRYAMQPWMDRRPGMTFGPWGTCIDRTQTWFEPGRAWFKYLARCQYLLQQGDFVADLCFFQGEAAPNHAPTRRELRPSLPSGYDYDGCNDEAILRMTVDCGRIALPSGMRYRVLVLPESRTMTPRLLGKVRELVAAGAHVVGPKPEKSPSLADYPKCDEEVRRLADELWGDTSKPGEKATGKGRVYWGCSLEAVLSSLDIPPDVQVQHEPDRSIPWIHRRVDGAEVYFLSNQEDYPKQLDVTFRLAGMLPELWDADTGRIEPAGVWRPTRDGRTAVFLRLEPRGSVFVVFRKPAGQLDPLVAVSLDGQSLIEPSTPAQIVIHKATYGVLDDPKRTLDVTKHVADRASKGQRAVKVWSTLGGDPAPGVRKTLRVEYSLDGTKLIAIGKDGDELRLRAGSAPELPPAEITIVDARPVLVASTGGRYEVQTASGKTLVRDVPPVPAPITLAGPWKLGFPSGWGAPESVMLDRLISWTEHADEGVKYFSGTATYRKTFELPADRLLSGQKLFLDLGRVAVIAEVNLNGRDLGILWKLPRRVEITGGARPGVNKLEVRVTNLWPNRLIGDEKKPPYLKWNKNGGPAEWPDWVAEGGPVPKTGRYTFTTWHQYEKDSPLLESGLLGPVTLQSSRVVPLESSR